MKERHIGQVSFNLLDEYEKDLWEYATKKQHGKFSQYVKRLIEQDRIGKRNIYNDVLVPEDSNEDISAAESFL